MGTISKKLHKLSTGWITTTAVAIFLIFLVWVLPQQAETAARNTGSDQSPDTLLHYTVNDLYRMAEAFGDTGRAAYIRARFTFDLIFPLVYTAFLTTTISWSLQRVQREESFWGLANLAPVLGMVFDYLENITASLVMSRYPDKTPVIDNLAPIFTLLKWIFIYGSFILLLAGIVWVIWLWAASRIKRKSL